MTAMASRSMAGVTAGLVVTISLTGCRATADKSRPAANARPSSTPTSSAPAPPRSPREVLAKTSDNVAGITSFQGKISVALSGQGIRSTMKCDTAIQLKPAQMARIHTRSAKFNGRSLGSFDEILTPDHAYVHFPGMEEDTGKSWLGYSLTEAQKSGSALGGLQDQGDPSTNVDMFRYAGHLRKVGTELVGGITTTRYRGVVSVKDPHGGLTQSERRKMNELFGQLGTSKVNFDLWIDGRQMPRKFTLTTPSFAAMKLHETMIYQDFNVPLSITAPPPDEVMDGKDYEQGGGGGVPGIPA